MAIDILSYDLLNLNTRNKSKKFHSYFQNFINTFLFGCINLHTRAHTEMYTQIHRDTKNRSKRKMSASIL